MGLRVRDGDRRLIRERFQQREIFGGIGGVRQLPPEHQHAAELVLKAEGNDDLG